MSFSAEWLALREPVDHASRSPELAAQVQSFFAARDAVQVVDLGCGTGSNLRATAALLPDRQAWTLVDYDPALLIAARRTLAFWADAAKETPDGLALQKGGKYLAIRFLQCDLNTHLDEALGATPDLVTASALFDLISERWISDFALRLKQRRAAFYTVLTYDGQDAFAPKHPLDAQVIAAFAAHQGGDKGFGPAAGPEGANALARAFRAVGYGVFESESPWRIGPDNAALAAPLLDGIANAVGQTGKIDAGSIGDWLAFRQSQIRHPGTLLVTGHRDTFAIPA